VAVENQFAREPHILVAVPTGEVLAAAEEIRASIQEQYGIYPEVPPPLHFTLERIWPGGEAQLARAIESIRSITSQSPPFEIRVCGFDYYEAPHLAVALRVERCPIIAPLSRALFDDLRGLGIAVRDDYKEWRFHITVAGTYGAERAWSEQEFGDAARWVGATMDIDAACQVSQLELWGPRYDPQLDVLATFPLAGSTTDELPCD
jgi:2'-5' RNA ligase